MAFHQIKAGLHHLATTISLGDLMEPHRLKPVLLQFPFKLSHYVSFAATWAWTECRRRAIIPSMTLTVGEQKTNLRRERLLGAYLFALCAYQIGIYFWPGGPPFILDPRAGIPVLLINHFSFDNKVIYPVEWITATWLVLAASMIFFRGRFLKPYLIAEIILAAPTAYYICVLAIRHGGDFAPAFKDLVITALLFAVFSLIPAGLAARRILARRKARA